MSGHYLAGLDYGTMKMGTEPGLLYHNKETTTITVNFVLIGRTGSLSVGGASRGCYHRVWMFKLELE